MSTLIEADKVKFENLSSYGPYYGANNGVTWEVAGVKLHVFTYEGFNARGMIGTEFNGIGIVELYKNEKRLVLDGWMRIGTGNDGLEQKLKERARIYNMNISELN